MFSVNLLDKIAENPTAYQSLLRPWANDPDRPGLDDWQVFSRQVDSWHDFRRWQRDNRNFSRPDGGFDDEDEFSSFATEHKVREYILGDRRPPPPGYDDTILRPKWLVYHRKKRWQKRRWCRETDGHETFAGYVEAARQRLREHGFTQPFQFHEDAKLQDAWTTWVEYIEFNCWELDHDIHLLVNRLQPEHDAEWKKLQEAGILRATETPENAVTSEALCACMNETVRAAEALDRSRQLLGMPPRRFGRRQGPATAGGAAMPIALQKAEAALELLETRSDHFRAFDQKTWHYTDGKRRVRHRKALIPWLKKVASQIWDEEQQVKRQQVAADGGRKRGRDEDRELWVEPGTKRTRGDAVQGTNGHQKNHFSHSAIEA